MSAAADPGADEAGAVEVRLPAALVALHPEAARSVRLPAGSLSAILDGLDRRFPGIRARIADERPAIRRHMAVFVDGERAGLGTTVRPGAVVHVLLAISGG